MSSPDAHGDPAESGSLTDTSGQGSQGGQATPPWRFLVDESMPRQLYDDMCAAGYESEYGRDVGLQGQPDSVVFTYAQHERRTIITLDKGQGGIVRYPTPHAGIIVARLPGQMATPLRVQLIMARLRGLAGTDFADSVVVIDTRRVRVRHA